MAKYDKDYWQQQYDRLSSRRIQKSSKKSEKTQKIRSDSFLGYTAERTWDNFKDVFKNIHKNAQINASAGYGEDVLKQLDKLKESSAGKGWNKKGIEQLEQAFRSSIEQTRKRKR